MWGEHRLVDQNGRHYIFTVFKRVKDNRNVERYIGASHDSEIRHFLTTFSKGDNPDYFFRDLIKDFYPNWTDQNRLNDQQVIDFLTQMMHQRWLNVFQLRINQLNFYHTPMVELEDRSAAIAETKANRERAKALKQREKAVVTDWIEIELLDDEGNPVPDEAYKIVLPDNRTIWGKLDKDGKAKHEYIVSGTCQVSFPELEGSFGEPYEEPDQATESTSNKETDQADQKAEEKPQPEKDQQLEPTPAGITASQTPEEEYELFYAFSNYVKNTYDKLDSPVNKMIQSSGDAA